MVADRGAGIVLTGRIVVVAETGSTNADLLQLARDGSGEDGLWLRAERQSAGRGRQGRAWQSPPGNLYASTLVALRPSDPPAATLALVAGVALAETIVAGGCTAARIKWPNDVLVEGAKVAGILLERAGDWVVIGIGVNLAHAPALPDRATAALAEWLRDPAVPGFARALAEVMERGLATWRGGLAPVIARWSSLAHPRGTQLRAALPDGSVAVGAFDGLAADGALILRLADGTTRAIHAGDVFLV